MITAREDAGDPRAGEREWDAMREARARMLRDRVRDRAMRDPAVEALGYWASPHPDVGPGRRAAPSGGRD